MLKKQKEFNMELDSYLSSKRKQKQAKSSIFFDTIKSKIYKKEEKSPHEMYPELQSKETKVLIIEKDSKLKKYLARLLWFLKKEEKEVQVLEEEIIQGKEELIKEEAQETIAEVEKTEEEVKTVMQKIKDILAGMFTGQEQEKEKVEEIQQTEATEEEFEEAELEEDIAEKRNNGFFSWFKSLFAGNQKEETITEEIEEPEKNIEEEFHEAELEEEYAEEKPKGFFDFIKKLFKQEEEPVKKRKEENVEIRKLVLYKTQIDQDVKQILKVTDKMLEDLPSYVKDKFRKSDDFITYETIIKKYKIR